MELTEQQRQLEKSTAEAHGSLSLGLFATALFVCNTTAGLWWIAFVVLGVVLALSGMNLAVVHRWKRKEFLEIAANVRLSRVAWFLGFSALGIGLIQIGCLAPIIFGVLFIGIAYGILLYGIKTEAKKVRKIKAKMPKAKTA